MNLKLKKTSLKKLSTDKQMPLNATPAIAGGRPPVDIDTLQCASMLPCLTKVTCTDCVQL